MKCYMLYACATCLLSYWKQSTVSVWHLRKFAAKRMARLRDRSCTLWHPSCEGVVQYYVERRMQNFPSTSEAVRFCCTTNIFVKLYTTTCYSTAHIMQMNLRVRKFTRQHIIFSARSTRNMLLGAVACSENRRSRSRDQFNYESAALLLMVGWTSCCAASVICARDVLDHQGL